MYFRFERHISGAEQLVPDLRSACYKGVLVNADEATLNQFLKLYRTAELHEEKDRIGRALGAIQDVKLLEKVLQFSLTVIISKLSNQYTLSVFRIVWT